MNSKQLILIIINIIGGFLVIGSYIYIFKTQPQAQSMLWGNVPERLKPIYYFSMLLAACSYFIFTLFILLRINPNEVKIADLFGYGLFSILYLLMLIPSALWGSLTVSWSINGKETTWIAIRIALSLVAIASLGILIALLAMKPRQSGGFYWSAIISITVFFLHCGILDALVWTHYYNK